jgi:hypothetical protein
MVTYSHDRNTVEGVPFEFLKPMPQMIPLRQRLTPDVLRQIIEQHPKATLVELCERARQEYRVALSFTSMSRLLRQVGFTCGARRKLAASTDNSLLSLAA